MPYQPIADQTEQATCLSRKEDPWHISCEAETLCNDPETFFKLQKAYRKDVHTKVEALMKGVSERCLNAEDLTSMAFEAIYRRLSRKGIRLKRRNGIVDYATKTAKNLLLQHLRRTPQGMLPEEALPCMEADGGMDTAVESRDDFLARRSKEEGEERLLSEFKSYFENRPIDREVIRRRIVFKQKFATIGEEMGKEEDAVRQVYFRAMDRFRKMVLKKGGVKRNRIRKEALPSKALERKNPDESGMDEMQTMPAVVSRFKNTINEHAESLRDRKRVNGSRTTTEEIEMHRKDMKTSERDELPKKKRIEKHPSASVTDEMLIEEFMRLDRLLGTPARS